MSDYFVFLHKIIGLIRSSLFYETIWNGLIVFKISKLIQSGRLPNGSGKLWRYIKVFVKSYVGLTIENTINCEFFFGHLNIFQKIRLRKSLKCSCTFGCCKFLFVCLLGVCEKEHSYTIEWNNHQQKGEMVECFFCCVHLSAKIVFILKLFDWRIIILNFFIAVLYCQRSGVIMSRA